MAKARGLSESEFLRAVILAVTGEDGDADQPIEPDAKKADTARMTVRMPRFLMEATGTQAKIKGMAPSRYVAALVQSNLLRQPVLTDDELAGLRASNRELAAIGRNLNQIARTLNDAFHETERVKIEQLAQLRDTIVKQRAAVSAVVRASQKSWATDDGAD